MSVSSERGHPTFTSTTPSPPDHCRLPASSVLIDGASVSSSLSTFTPCRLAVGHVVCLSLSARRRLAVRVAPAWYIPPWDVVVPVWPLALPGRVALAIPTVLRTIFMATIIIVPAPHHWYQKGLDPGVDLDLINPRTRPIYQKEIVSKSIQDRQVIYIKINK